MSRSGLPEITEAEFQRGEAIGRLEVENGASAVRYDRACDQLVITMKSGAVAIMPRRTLPWLKNANPDDLDDVEVTPLCSSLLFSKLDEMFSVFGLIREAFGINTQNRIAAMMKSPSRARASRENGKKGGRPKKKTAAR